VELASKIRLCGGFLVQCRRAAVRSAAQRGQGGRIGALLVYYCTGHVHGPCWQWWHLPIGISCTPLAVMLLANERGDFLVSKKSFCTLPGSVSVRSNRLY
jgi:hypothetical protein